MSRPYHIRHRRKSRDGWIRSAPPSGSVRRLVAAGATSFGYGANEGDRRGVDNRGHAADRRNYGKGSGLAARTVDNPVPAYGKSVFDMATEVAPTVGWHRRGQPPHQLLSSSIFRKRSASRRSSEICAGVSPTSSSALVAAATRVAERCGKAFA